MLIAFLAFIALFDYVLGLINPALTLAQVFSRRLRAGRRADGRAAARTSRRMADLLGTKLVANEFVAFVKLTSRVPHRACRTRSYVLATYALTGFANFGSIGIQLGGIGAMAPTRRSDLARLGTRALFARVPGDAHQRIDRVDVSAAVVADRHAGSSQEPWSQAARPASGPAMSYFDHVEASRRVRARRDTARCPDVAIVLGSGLGAFADRLECADGAAVRATSRTGRPRRVIGHAGTLVVGRVAGRGVAVLAGRAHFYEGHALDDGHVRARACSAAWA